LGRLFTLHRGELDALQLCRQFANCLFLTDDMAARSAANQLGLPVHGTIGILLRAIRRLQRSREQVIDLLQILPSRSTLHLKLSLLEEIIAAVKSQE
jgi:predicted nucleic acid-binding protein